MLGDRSPIFPFPLSTNFPGITSWCSKQSAADETHLSCLLSTKSPPHQPLLFSFSMTSSSSSVLLNLNQPPTKLFKLSWDVNTFVRYSKQQQVTIVMSLAQWNVVFERFVQLAHGQSKRCSQDEFLERLVQLEQNNCTIDVSQALQLVTCRRSLEFDELDTNATYLQSVYKLLVAVIERVSDGSLLRKYMDKAVKCKERMVLHKALKARLDTLGSATTVTPSTTVQVAPASEQSAMIRSLQECLCGISNRSVHDTESELSDDESSDEEDSEDDLDDSIDISDASDDDTDDNSSSSNSSSESESSEDSEVESTQINHKKRKLH